MSVDLDDLDEGQYDHAVLHDDHSENGTAWDEWGLLVEDPYPRRLEAQGFRLGTSAWDDWLIR